MKVIEHGKHTIEFFDSPEEMTMRRYQRFNKFLMIANEVGSDFEDYNARTNKAIKYLQNGFIDKAVQELENRRQMVFNAFQEYDPSGRALACLVHSINGVVYSDFTKNGLNQILNHLEEIGFTKKQADETTLEVKKKSKMRLVFSFHRNLIMRKQRTTTASM